MALKLRDLNWAFCRVEGRNCPLRLGSSEPGNGPGTLSAPVMGQEGMCSVCQVAGLSCGSQTFEGLRQGQGDQWGRPRGRACASTLPSPFVPFPSPFPRVQGLFLCPRLVGIHLEALAIVRGMTALGSTSVMGLTEHSLRTSLCAVDSL